jgi:hypothetical protein
MALFVSSVSYFMLFNGVDGLPLPVHPIQQRESPAGRPQNQPRFFG